MLVCKHHQMWHGASYPSLRKALLMLDRLESSDWKLVLAMEEACHLSSSRAFLHHPQWALLLTSSLSSTKTSLVRLKDEKCENVTLVCRLFVLFAIWFKNLRDQFASVNLSGSITSSSNSRSTLCLEESQRLKVVVLDALSVFSRIFRPPIDSAETSGPWCRHCHNTGRKGKWDTEKNGYSNKAHVQCHHSWMNRCVSLWMQTLNS